MTTIRTTCPSCGEVDMSPEAILLSIRDPAGEGCYRFSCPTCMRRIEKPADRKVVALLLSAGVELDEQEEREREAAERARRIAELEARPGGPAFTLDDVIAFHFLLEDEEDVRTALGTS